MSDLVKRLRALAVPNPQIADDVVRIEALSLMLNEAADRIEALEAALQFARKRIEYYGTISPRRYFDHDLAEVYPRIDAALAPEPEK